MIYMAFKFTSCGTSSQHDEFEELGKRLFADFNKAFSRLAKVSEVGTIFTEVIQSEVNVCPIHIEDSHIGIEKWCMKYLYTYAYHQLMSVLNKENYFDSSHVCNLIRCVVIFSPDCTSAWNLKKQMYIAHYDGFNLKAELLADLDLATLALKRHPKSTEAFAHRRYILKHLFVPKQDVFCALSPTPSTERVCKSCSKVDCFLKPLRKLNVFDLTKDLGYVEKELTLCRHAAAWHPSNYNAWSHAVWILTDILVPFLMKRLTQSSDTCDLQTNDNICVTIIDILISEFESTSAWIELHVSDYSCMAYVQLLLKYLTYFSAIQADIACSCDNFSKTLVKLKLPQLINVCDFWNNVIQQNTDLLILHCGVHEALWSHRRGLMLLYYKFARYVLSALNEMYSNDGYKEKFQINEQLLSYDSNEQLSNKFIGIDNNTAGIFAAKYLKYLNKFVLK